MGEAARGLLAIVAACTIWGLSPLFYKLLAQVPPLELLAHRTLWSLVAFGAVLLLRGRLAEVGRLFGNLRGALLVVLAALMISANWFVFILSTQIGRVVESSLGYYIFPLVAVLLGRVLFAERLGPARWLAVALAAAGVAVLAAGLGAPPWISLLLAFTFGAYGALKKVAGAPALVSVFGEVLVLAPLAALWLAGLHAGLLADPSGRPGALFLGDGRTAALLMLSGPLTAVPLMLFSYASRRLTLATLGLMQYLNPSLQFLCAVLIFAEPFTRWHAIAFGLIWLALALYSVAGLAAERRGRSAARRAGTSGTAPM